MNIKNMMRTTAGFGMTALRIPIGIIFIGHGLPKYGWNGGSLSGTAEFMGSLGLPFPQLMAILAGGAEIFGGALLVLGLFTRFAAATLAVTMFVAIFWVHWDNGLLGSGGYQWALALFAASIALMLDGAGKLSVDQMLSSSER